jgi:hypothetical protein
MIRGEQPHPFPPFASPWHFPPQSSRQSHARHSIPPVFFPKCPGPYHEYIAEVRKLPLREKFQILEVIWDDLSAHMEEMAVSPSVSELLESRLERIANGSAEVHDWDTVKYSIGQR